MRGGRYIPPPELMAERQRQRAEVDKEDEVRLRKEIPQLLQNGPLSDASLNSATGWTRVFHSVVEQLTKEGLIHRAKHGDSYKYALGPGE